MIFLIFIITFVSAVRLPTVDGDSGSWGTLLNEFLSKFVGADATYLNVSGNITAGEYFIGDGSQLINIGATFHNITSITYNGSITNGSLVGYQAANQICDLTFADTHLCTTDEIIQTIRNKNISSIDSFVNLDTAWIIEGPPGYNANVNDCQGWTSDSNSDLGPFWAYNKNGGGMGWLTNCESQKALSCCK